MESSDARGGEGKAGVRLFGVMISAGGGAAEEKDGRAREWAGEEIIRKSRSMSNLAAAADPAAENAAFERGYLSEGGLQKSGKRRRRRAGAAAHERKKGEVSCLSSFMFPFVQLRMRVPPFYSTDSVSPFV